MEAEEEEGKEAVTGLDEDRLVQTLSDIFFGKPFLSFLYYLIVMF